MVECAYRYEPDTQIKRITTYHRRPGVPEEVTGALDMRMYFPQELDALLQYNGLRILQKHGGQDGRPDSPLQVIVSTLDC